ncbi:MAG: hypothetical protein RL490_989, partial [Pseudomonadota bacterium]
MAAGLTPGAFPQIGGRMIQTGPTSHSYMSQRLKLHYADWGNASAPPLLL